MRTFFSNCAVKLREVCKSWALVLVVAVVIGLDFAFEYQGGITPKEGVISSWIGRFGLFGADVMHGQVWKLFTYAWLHGGQIHLGLNLICLMMLGSRIEQMLGSRVFLTTLFAGIIGGGMGHLPMSWAGDQAPILIGMSGGCVALLLLLTTLSPESRMWPLPVSGKALGMGLVLGELILTIIDPRLGIPGLQQLGIWMKAHRMGEWFLVGHSCHLGGALAGWAIGRWMLRQRVSLKSLHRQRQRREARMGEGQSKI